MKTPTHRSPTGTVLLFASATLVGGLIALLIAEILSEKSLEHLARHAAGESDFERHHPHHPKQG